MLDPVFSLFLFFSMDIVYDISNLYKIYLPNISFNVDYISVKLFHKTQKEQYFRIH